VRRPKFRRTFNGRMCQHISYSLLSAATGTIFVNKAGTHQVCIGCDWKRPLKKHELALRRWAKQRAAETGRPIGLLLSDADVRAAFMAGWTRLRKAC
jgi:hypothetical protein